MDSITQIVLGASVGYAVAGKQYGKKAMLWGAALGTLPDLDFLATLTTDDELLYLKIHRGITHSLLFSLIAPIGLAWVMNKWKGLNKKTIWALGFWVFLTHTVLDAFTTWGTQIFWPLAHRASWNTLFIVDPLYTIPFGLCLGGAAILKSPHRSQVINTIGIVVSTLYIGWALSAKLIMNTRFEALFEHYNHPIERYTTRPTAFNTVLWSATAETQDGYYYALLSFFDTSLPEPLFFKAKQHTLLDGFTDQRSKDIIAITNGYFTVETTENGIRINDLRYGYRGDPHKHGPQYVFSYDLSKDNQGKTQVTTINPQSRSNSSMLLGELWERVKGI